MSELSCARCVELTAEVALGAADAEDRADVLVHVEHCADCATSLRTMTEVADGLAQLVPPADPPAGFATRVLDEIEREAASVTEPTFATRTRARWLMAAAAVVVAVGLSAGGWLVGTRNSANSGPVVASPLVSHGATLGDVVVTPRGLHPWISMSVHAPGVKSRVWCKVREDDGTLVTLGSFSIVNGHGYWAAPLPYEHAVRAATLVMSGGKVLGTATIPTS